MTECEEVAETMNPPPELTSMDKLRRWVRTQISEGESETVIDNVAWALYRRPR